jgi:hypothetical protein
MFLDEQLYEIGIKAIPTNRDSVIKAIKDMLQTSFKSISSEITDINILRANIKRANTSWNLATKRLKREGKDIVKEDGFLLFIKSKPEFKGIFK